MIKILENPIHNFDDTHNLSREIKSKNTEKLTESFHPGICYKIITIDGDELIWKPSDDYYDQDFFKDVQQKFPDITSLEDIYTISEIDR